MQPTQRPIRHTRRSIAAALAAAATVVALAAPAAGASSKPVLTVDGRGTWTAAGGGAAVTATGAVYDRANTAHPAQIRATLTPSDGSLPAPETCEPATAVFEVTGDRTATLTLAGSGQVCGRYPQVPTSVVTHVFTGRYEVTAAAHKRVLGTDGWYEIRLALDDVAGVFAVDT